MITLVSTGPGTYTEPGQDVVWIRDAYTEPREAEFGCCECEQPITEWEFWTCLDGGEAAHMGCVQTITDNDLDMLRTYADGPKIWDAASLVSRVFLLADRGLTEPVPDSRGAYRLTERGRKVLYPSESEGR